MENLSEMPKFTGRDGGGAPQAIPWVNITAVGSYFGLRTFPEEKLTGKT